MLLHNHTGHAFACWMPKNDHSDLEKLREDQTDFSGGLTKPASFVNFLNVETIDV